MFGAKAMDEDQAIGVMGILLIVTVLVFTNSLQPSYAKPTFRDFHLQDVVSFLSCGDSETDRCYLAMAQ